jgi:hypothetical protein
MNIISIDPSLISTALIVFSNNNFKIFNYCRESSSFGQKGFKKWYKLCEEYVNYRFVDYRKYKNYSDGELVKLKDYDKITDMIISDILNNINKEEDIQIGIEGYSFSSNDNSLIDLVTFSTLLRKKLFDTVSENIIVLSPSTLKLEACKLTYQPTIKTIKSKKERIEYIYKNNSGISGGRFTKTDIYKSIIENENLTDYWATHCKKISADIEICSKINKPYEDINDAYLIFKILEKNV